MFDCRITVDIRMKSADVYFKPHILVDENRVRTYRRLSKIDSFDEHEIDQRSLLQAAEELQIKTDSDFCVSIQQ